MKLNPIKIILRLLVSSNLVVALVFLLIVIFIPGLVITDYFSGKFTLAGVRSYSDLIDNSVNRNYDFLKPGSPSDEGWLDTSREPGKSYAEVADSLGIPRYLLIGIHTVETNRSLDGKAVSYTGALGPLQFQPSTWNYIKNSYIVHPPGSEAAKEARARLSPYGGKYSGYKFEEVIDWQEFVNVTSGAGNDFDGDNKADPRIFRDAIYSAGMKIRGDRNQVISRFGVEGEIADYCSALFYIGFKYEYLPEVIGFLQDVKDKYGTIIISPMERKGDSNIQLRNKFNQLRKEFGYNKSYGGFDQSLLYGFMVVNYGKQYMFSYQETGMEDGWQPAISTFDWPVDMKYISITSPYNERRVHPITGKVSPHRAIDIKIPTGNPVYAVESGIVIQATRTSGYGNMIVIRHDNGYESMYAHLDKRLVKNNMRVKRGEVIGLSGNTGFSTGPHLHFEIRVNGVGYNPVLFYR